MNLSRTENNFVLQWVVTHIIAWPLSLLSAFWVGWNLLGWLAYHIPGEPRLSYGWYPNHEYINSLLLIVFLLGGAIIGLVVGTAQWFILRRVYRISATWIIISVLIWSLSGIIPKLVAFIFVSISEISIINIFISHIVGGFISGFWLERILRNAHLQITPHQIFNITGTNLSIYIIVFSGIVAGLAMSVIMIIIANQL
ncbi:MAG: hypothetical protein ACOYNY_07100 [Caldilineaceae bacterium]